LLAKRVFDVAVSGVALIALAPVFLVIALAIKLDSAGGVFFRQERVGRFSQPFRIHKFRTMVQDAPSVGLPITVGSDSRITRTGAFLRKYKLDELPQLLDVFAGNMSLVGPRPEVPKYVSLYPADVRSIVLSVRPGITDWASIEFRNESELLSRAANPQEAYEREVLPVKLAYYVDYVRNRSFCGDLRIIAATIAAVFSATFVSS
jgi:lipopolysaccharide/colanic/teichoic acid biosynthesis glycosyltransferase